MSLGLIHSLCPLSLLGEYLLNFLLSFLMPTVSPSHEITSQDQEILHYPPTHLSKYLSKYIFTLLLYCKAVPIRDKFCLSVLSWPLSCSKLVCPISGRTVSCPRAHWMAQSGNGPTMFKYYIKKMN